MESFPLRMKRKSLEEFNDDFSDFTLSSPAQKIRRPDAELPAISEESKSEIPMTQPVPEQSSGRSRGSLVIEEISSMPDNEERAIVLYNPTNSPLLQSPSNFEVYVNPQLISGFKNQALWSGQSNSWRLVNDEASMEDENSDECLAVVPWVPLQLPSAPPDGIPPQSDNSEIMDAEEAEEARMDIEDNDIGVEQRNMNEAGGLSSNEGLHQWQRQHCMIPQPSQNTTTSILWHR
ncbi:hypothetical protein Fot_37130 [Forsythia ovata]|uniref:Uncharacterized protein n=1 Tax=Forsythia ovata TaxID=205694 RepID=A0ABD1SRE1_9LAMI